MNEPTNQFQREGGDNQSGLLLWGAGTMLRDIVIHWWENY